MSKPLYSVVRKVMLGTPCSYLPGEVEVDFSDSREWAFEYAARCNQFAAVSGITYRVMELLHDYDPSRLPSAREQIAEDRETREGRLRAESGCWTDH